MHIYQQKWEQYEQTDNFYLTDCKDTDWGSPRWCWNEWQRVIL